MNPNRFCNSSIRLFAVFTLSFGLVTTCEALELSIVESGPDSNTKVGLWAQDFRASQIRGISQLTSPSGDVFTPATVLENRAYASLLKQFDSLAEAFEYAQGSWQGLSPLWPPYPPATGSFDFNIGDVSIDTLNRTVPTLLSPNPGAAIKNGTTFLLGWDYPADAEAPLRTRIYRVPKFDAGSSWGSWSLSTPSPGGTIQSSSSTGVGDRLFSSKLTNVPGTDQNRFLVSFTAAEAALPLDVELTMGSNFSLNSAVTISYSPGTGFLSPPEVTFSYARQLDPFRITLIRVPEPSSLALVLLCVVGGWSGRSRVVRSRAVRRIDPLDEHCYPH